ncbi:MAG: 16S rRNA (cytidine(1402)-2'-O)-methyltransferase [Pseudobdellovibrionaceae bacterium]
MKRDHPTQSDLTKPEAFSLTLHVEKQKLEAGLYLIGTPIGNLKDITLRALETLASLDRLYCEDTRVTGKLLKHYGISCPLSVYTDHADEATRRNIVEQVRSGKAVGLASDAGLPLVSDPGFKLARDLVQGDVQLISIPGPSAALTALQISGLPSDAFTFAGFIPHKDGARRQLFETYRATPSTLIFYETATRMEKSLAAISATLGERQCVIARELTKKFEEVLRGTPAELTSKITGHATFKGEMVLLVAGAEEVTAHKEDVEALLRSALLKMSLKDAAAEVASVTGRKRKEVYALALTLKG